METFLWIVAILVVVYIIYDYSSMEESRIKGHKTAQEFNENEFIEENGISITTEYIYENSYFSNNVSLGSAVYYRVIIDDRHKKLYVFDKDHRVGTQYRDIIGCEIYSDSAVVGGVKRAAVGGILAGDTGAVVGAMTAKPHIMSYKVVIYRANISMPTIELTLIKQKTETRDKNYNAAVDFARDLLATIKVIVYQNAKESTT